MLQLETTPLQRIVWRDRSTGGESKAIGILVVVIAVVVLVLVLRHVVLVLVLRHRSAASVPRCIADSSSSSVCAFDYRRFVPRRIGVYNLFVWSVIDSGSQSQVVFVVIRPQDAASNDNKVSIEYTISPLGVHANWKRALASWSATSKGFSLDIDGSISLSLEEERFTWTMTSGERRQWTSCGVQGNLKIAGVPMYAQALGTVRSVAAGSASSTLGGMEMIHAEWGQTDAWKQRWYRQWLMWKTGGDIGFAYIGDGVNMETWGYVRNGSRTHVLSGVNLTTTTSNGQLRVEVAPRDKLGGLSGAHVFPIQVFNEQPPKWYADRELFWEQNAPV